MNTLDEATLAVLKAAAPVKAQPELRHVLAHLYHAIEAVMAECPAVALDELKACESSIFFDGGDPADWEKWYHDTIKPMLDEREGPDGGPDETSFVSDEALATLTEAVGESLSGQLGQCLRELRQFRNHYGALNA